MRMPSRVSDRCCITLSALPLSRDYSPEAAIKRRALRSEGNRPVPWSGLQTELVGERRENDSSARPSTTIVIEAVRLCAFAPPSSPLIDGLSSQREYSGLVAYLKTVIASCSKRSQ